MEKTVEILIYKLKDGSGDAFHKTMMDVSVPLHKSVGMDVVAYGNSADDPDRYFLIRAYDSLDHLEASQSAFYASDAWRSGPREAIVRRIESSLKSVLRLSHEAVEGMRRSFAPF